MIVLIKMELKILALVLQLINVIRCTCQQRTVKNSRGLFPVITTAKEVTPVFVRVFVCVLAGADPEILERGVHLDGKLWETRGLVCKIRRPIIN